MANTYYIQVGVHVNHTETNILSGIIFIDISDQSEIIWKWQAVYCEYCGCEYRSNSMQFKLKKGLLALTYI